MKCVGHQIRRLFYIRYGSELCGTPCREPQPHTILILVAGSPGCFILTGLFTERGETTHSTLFCVFFSKAFGFTLKCVFRFLRVHLCMSDAGVLALLVSLSDLSVANWVNFCVDETTLNSFHFLSSVYCCCPNFTVLFSFPFFHCDGFVRFFSLMTKTKM